MYRYVYCNATKQVLCVLLNSARSQILQMHVLMGTFDWWVAGLSTKEEWKSVSMEYGALCVIDTDIVATGTLQRQMLFAGNWDFQI